jgi:hypothetical protein
MVEASESVKDKMKSDGPEIYQNRPPNTLTRSVFFTVGASIANGTGQLWWCDDPIVHEEGTVTGGCVLC